MPCRAGPDGCRRGCACRRQLRWSDSTGYVDGSRYAVAILTSGSADQYGQYMSDTITQLARDVMLGGSPAAPGPGRVLRKDPRPAVPAGVPRSDCAIIYVCH